jgi:hypothetical protein
MKATYPFPIPEETVNVIENDEDLRPVGVWENYGGCDKAYPWIISALELWEC